MNDERRFAPATARNRDPISRVLDLVLPENGSVLEIASGSGEHSVHFCAQFTGLRFIPSDPDPEARTSIEAWRQHCGLPNLEPPLDLDVLDSGWSGKAPAVDAILCINMIHIATFEATEGLLAGAAQLLAGSAPLYLYGPYRRAGRHTADSNAAFDQSLRLRDPRSGIRNLETVERCARENGFVTDQVIEMPTNNLSLILRRTS